MIFKSIVGLLIVLIGCSCSKRTSKDSLQIGSGLLIENSPTRGFGYTDTLGTKYVLVYISTTIRNDSKIPIHIQMALPNEYDYPITYGEQKFKLLLWPKLTGDQVTSLDSTGNLIETLLDTDLDTPHIFNVSVEPGDTCIMTAGILRPMLANICSATPYAVLEYGDREIFPSCDWPMNEDRSPHSQYALGLKVGFCTSGEEYESCTIIPCGQISYPEH